MEHPPLTPTRVTVDELVARLDRLHRGRSPAVLAFDGDGTLWRGDVAEDVFHWILARRLLLAEAKDRLSEIARDHQLALTGDSNDLALGMFEAYAEGRFPERTVCEIMAWCFAGHSLEHLRALTRDALTETQLDARVNHTLDPVFVWARSAGVRVVVISASPRFVVEEAAHRFGVGPADIAGTTPALDAGRVLPRLASPVPYGPSKVQFGRQLFADSAWLASFGDSPFDLEMLGAAELGVAVRPKPQLLAALTALRRTVILED